MSALIQGIDVSHHNGHVDWHAQARAGVTFAFAKATESTGFTDASIGANFRDAKNNGVLIGAYHFLQPDVSGVAQARHFADVVRDHGPGVLMPMCDVERAPNGETRKYITKDVIEFLAETERLFGRVPGIYASPAFLNEHMTRDSRLGRYYLWLAKWQSRQNPIPATPPPFARVTFWQYDGQGTDNDAFTGSLHRLRQLAGLIPSWYHRSLHLPTQPHEREQTGPDVNIVRHILQPHDGPGAFTTHTADAVWRFTRSRPDLHDSKQVGEDVANAIDELYRKQAA